MPMLIALARGFRIDVFSVVDFDLNQAIQNQRNDEIVRYAVEAGDVIPNPPEHEFAGSAFFGWRHNIQATLAEECAVWDTIQSTIAQEWGWSLSEMKKDPMLLSEAVSRVIAQGEQLPPLARLTERLEAFWSR
ncbi:hypothetical protein [Brucella sp. IR073]|uniref:hypothetical protein n=1 Tax=unclassified Brucella TaxID=2632610 RepID=UPI003B97DF57